MAEYLLMATRDTNLAQRLSRLDRDVASRSELSDPATIHNSGHGRFHLTVGSPSREAFFDGVGVFGDRLATTEDAALAAGAGRGIYVAARHRDDGTIAIACDPLGTYPVFCHHQDGLFGISNNVFLLVDALGKVGRPIAKDPSLFASFVTFGGALNGMTGYRDVKLIPMGSIVTVHSDNRVTLDIPSMASVLYGDHSFESLLDEAASDVLGNIRVMTGAPHRRLVSDLTGGMDSRLVLAAILHEGMAENFEFHTLGRYPDPDANVADLIRARFGLKRHKSTREKSQPQPALFAHQPQPSLYARMCRTITRVGGLLEMFYLIPSTEQSDGSLMRFGGGLGELMREFWSSQHDPTSTTVPPLRGLMESMAGRSWLLTPTVAEGLQHAIWEKSLQMFGDGVKGEHLGTALYLNYRNNYHFGAFWRASWRSRFHPLYSPAALKAAHLLTVAERKANRVGYELMKRFYPDLLRIPFAKKSWNPLIAPGAPARITGRSPPLVERERERTSTRGRAEGMPKTVGRFAKMLCDFREQAPSPDFTSLAPVFAASKVRKFLGTKLSDFTDDKRRNTGFRLLAAHAWMNDLETDRSGVPHKARADG